MSWGQGSRPLSWAICRTKQRESWAGLRAQFPSRPSHVVCKSFKAIEQGIFNQGFGELTFIIFLFSILYTSFCFSLLHFHVQKTTAQRHDTAGLTFRSRGMNAHGFHFLLFYLYFHCVLCVRMCTCEQVCVLPRDAKVECKEPKCFWTSRFHPGIGAKVQ